MRHLFRRRTIVGLALLLPATAAAQQVLISTITGCDFATGHLEAQCIPRFIGHLIEVVFGLVSAFFLINVMYAGYQIAMGSWTGDRAAGKDRLIWSIIGLIICASAFLILNVALTVVLG